MPGTQAHGRLQAAILVIGALTILAAFALMASGHPPQLVTQPVLGIQGLIGGVGLLWAGHRGGRPAMFKTWFGVAILVLALGNALNLLSGSDRFPGPGDLVAPAALPFCLLALATLQRRSPEPYQGIRLALESAMLGSVSTLLLWAFVSARSSLMEPGELAMCLADTTTLAMILITILRDPGRDLLVTAVGGAGIVAPDLINTVLNSLDSAGGPQWLGTSTSEWFSTPVYTAGWPLLIIGLLRLSVNPPEIGERAYFQRELRRYIIVSTLFTVLALDALVILVRHPGIEAESVALIVTAMLSLWARELIRANQLRSILQQLSTLAHHDPLTSLGNRRALSEEFLSLRQNYRGPVSLLTLDLDGFKNVNDQLGHSAGDDLLARVGDCLRREATGVTAQAFRVGGDEFVVVARIGAKDAVQLAQRLLQLLELAAHETHHAQVSVGASIGIAQRQLSDGVSAGALQDLLTEAGAAMRMIKRDPTHRFLLFDEKLAAAHRRRVDIELGLRWALSTKRIEARFQPIVALPTGKMIGAETLARWNDPRLGEVSPAEFVPVAEECGLINELGEYLLRQSLAAIVAAGFVEREMSMSINVSTLQLRMPGYVGLFRATLAEFGVPPRLLAVEVTESVFVRPDDPAIAALHELARMGTKICLDDFGTGYSSLSYLSRFPVKALKLDRSLVVDLENQRTWAIARAIVDMAAGLGLQVVVEGVETERHALVATGLGAGAAQGWLYHPALSRAELAGVVRAEGPPPGAVDDGKANGLRLSPRPGSWVQR